CLVLWLIPQIWLAQGIAFVLFRFFDILKPPPVRYFDRRLHNGLVVMLDDLRAACYTLLLMVVIVDLGGFLLAIGTRARLPWPWGEPLKIAAGWWPAPSHVRVACWLLP